METTKNRYLLTHMAIIKSLMDGSKKTQNQIVKETGYEKSTISHAIDYLEKRKVIVRESIKKESGYTNKGLYKNKLCRLAYEIDDGIPLLNFLEEASEKYPDFKLYLREKDKIISLLSERYDLAYIKQFFEFIGEMIYERNFVDKDETFEDWKKGTLQEEYKLENGDETFDYREKRNTQENRKICYIARYKDLFDTNKFKNYSSEAKKDFKKCLKVSPTLFDLCLKGDFNTLNDRFREVFKLTELYQSIKIQNERLQKECLELEKEGYEIQKQNSLNENSFNILYYLMDSFFKIGIYGDILGGFKNPEATEFIEERFRSESPLFKMFFDLKKSKRETMR